MTVKGVLQLAGKALVAQHYVSLTKWFYRKIRIKLSGRTKVSHQGILEYIMGLGKIYRESNKERKGQLLQDATQITRKSERTILRYLQIDPAIIQKRIDEKRPIRAGRGRKPKYERAALLPHIKALWILMERICSRRMKAALPEWLKYYQADSLTEELRMQLLTMSKGTLESILAQIRRSERANSGLSTTTPGRVKAMNRVPINRYDQQITRPGFAQADTVAHCGTSVAGT
jgi:hypothetical protein